MNQEIVLVLVLVSVVFLLAGFFNRQALRDRALRIISKVDENKIEEKPRLRHGDKSIKATKLYPFLGSLGGLLLSFYAGQKTIPNFIIAALTGYGVVHLVSRVARETKMKRSKEEVEFFLPIFMEQIVMGVQAGLDVVPAIKEALLGGAAGTGKLREMLEDTITLSEKGIPFTQALDQVSSKVDVPTVRHAFIHLKLAFSQGGELVRPLRELSDATQLQYQESVEEEIAKLPVKAVMPLVLTFAGLMICFLTVPIVQLSSIMKSVTPQEIAK